MKKTFLLLVLLSTVLVACANTELQTTPAIATQDPNIENTVEVNPTETPAIETESPIADETSFVETDAVELTETITAEEDDHLAGKVRWISDFSTFSLNSDQEETNRFSSPLLPTITEMAHSQHYFFGRGYAFDDLSFYLPSGRPGIISVDSLTGSENWMSEISGYVVAVGSETVFVLTAENRVYGLDKESGEVSWKIILEMLFDENTYLEITPLMHKQNDRFVMIIRTHDSSRDSKFWLLQINESTGDYELIQADSALNEHYVPFYYSDNLFIAMDDPNNSVVGVNYADGNITWAIEKPTINDGHDLDILEIDVDKNILYLWHEHYSYENHDLIQDLLAVDMAAGNLIWGGSLSEVNNFPAGLGSVDGPGRVSGCYLREGYLICNVEKYDSEISHYFIYDRKTGQLLNRIVPERRSYTYLSENGLIVNYYEVGILQGIDYETGEILWQDDETELGQWRTYLTYKDIVVVKGSDLTYFAINQQSGTQGWKRKSRDFCGIIDGKLITSNYGSLIFIDPYTGEEQEIPEASFSCDSGSIEYSGKTLILSDIWDLTVIDLND